MSGGSSDVFGKKKKLFYLARPASGGMRSHLQQLLGRFSGDYTLYLGSPEREGMGSAGLPVSLTA